MSRLAFAAFLALTAAFSSGAPFVTNTAMAGSENEAAKSGGTRKAVVVTGEQPGTVAVEAPAFAGQGSALEIKARPVGKEGASPPYLVGVYVSEGRTDPASQTLFGTFSFFPANPNEVQTFVIPRSSAGAVLGKDSKVSVKLIPANPARDIKDAAVEILGARIVE